MTAFLFSGQLSEFMGMGRDFVERSPEARALFEEASRASGADLYPALQEGPEGAIRENRVAQPSVFTLGVIAARELSRRGVSPGAVCGYSLGTYAALVAAGAVSFSDALTVILAVLDASRRLGIRGAMGYVIGVPLRELEGECARLREEGNPVWVGNINAATQIVISGTEEGVVRAVERLAPRALKAERLPMSWPIHSPLFAPVAEAIAPLVAGLTSVASPRVPFYAAHVAGRLTTAEEVRDLLARQVGLPSRWKETVERMCADGHREFLEVGPGQTLSRMMRWIVRSAECRPAGTLSEIEAIAAGQRGES